MTNYNLCNILPSASKCALIWGAPYKCKVDTIALCVSSTPFGKPVVPLEYGRKTTSLERALSRIVSVSPLHALSKLITPGGMVLFFWNKLVYYVCF